MSPPFLQIEMDVVLLLNSNWDPAAHIHPLELECQTHFHWGHISLAVAFKGPNIMLGLYNCNYSLTVKPELGATATCALGGVSEAKVW